MAQKIKKKLITTNILMTIQAFITKYLALTIAFCVVPAVPDLIGLPSYQSSTAWEGTPDRANDGRVVGDFMQGQACSHTDEEVQPWWAVDLGGSFFVDGVYLWSRSDCCCELSTK